MALVGDLFGSLPIFQEDFNLLERKKSAFSDGTLLLSTTISQTLGETNYSDVESPSFKSTFFSLTGVQAPSEETLRQRLNQVAKDPRIGGMIDDCNVELLKLAPISPTIYGGKEYIPLDIDVTPFLNPDVTKEGVGRTYKGVDGFAPIMAYLGHYALDFELRPGTQHSEKGAVDFLNNCIDMAIRIGYSPSQLLVRVDGAHDDSKFVEACSLAGVGFIIARNLRKESPRDYARFMKINSEGIFDPDEPTTMTHRCIIEDKKPANFSGNVRCIAELKEEYKDKNGTLLMEVDDPHSADYANESWRKYRLQTFWTNVEVINESGEVCNDEAKYVEECMWMYREHATSEQFHSELKTDMNMELLPSHHFATNSLILKLSVLAFNALRLISDNALLIGPTFKSYRNRKMKLDRIRIATTIKSFMKVPFRLVRHAKKIIFRLGREYIHYKTFVTLHNFFRA